MADSTLTDDDYYSTDSDAIDATPPADVVSYTELRSVADLCRMYKQGDLNIQPDFQREAVWAAANQTRFIDSLIKQLPIPSLCLGFDFKKQNWQVIDGLQRLTSAFKFLDTTAQWKMSNLDDVDQRLAGRTNTEFENDPDLSILRRTVENTVLPITVVRCDSDNKAHREYLFKIFRRLNTGGVKLNNQEIRNCVYTGSFNNLLNELNASPLWLSVSPFKKTSGYRFKGQEMILRVLAFSDSYIEYRGNLAAFLNDYMDEHRDCSQEEAEQKRKVFEDALSCVEQMDGSLVDSLSKTVFEALLVGLSVNRDHVLDLDSTELTEGLELMLSQPQFSKENLSEGLASREKLISRLNAASEAFCK